MHADKAMEEVFDAVYASLHVRVSNRGAKHLYTQTLGYECDPSMITGILHCLTIPASSGNLQCILLPSLLQGRHHKTSLTTSALELCKPLRCIVSLWHLVHIMPGRG